MKANSFGIRNSINELFERKGSDMYVEQELLNDMGKAEFLRKISSFGIEVWDYDSFSSDSPKKADFAKINNENALGTEMEVISNQKTLKKSDSLGYGCQESDVKGMAAGKLLASLKGSMQKMTKLSELAEEAGCIESKKTVKTVQFWFIFFTIAYSLSITLFF